MSGTRLSARGLAALPLHVAKPDYDRSRVRIGVVHLGIGAFHRAHQAVVFDDALKAGDLRWGILGASLRSPDVRDQLAPQDGLYTLLIEDGAQRALRIVGAVQGVRVAPRDPASLVEAMASADVHIVTLTVTEKGYCLDPASGSLKLDDPGIVADLADLSAPVTAPGFVTAALRLRRDRGLSPFTVISCDNLPHNGARMRSAVLEMAARIDPLLHDWIAVEGAFPQTMIDRIVPATTLADIEALAAELGAVDLGMVKTEPFTQWIIEDWFAGERPDFARFKVRLTEAVGPWEDAKLRLLNGAHSALAYLGALAGLEYVHETVAVPVLRAFVERLWDEAEATLDPPPGLDIAAYRAELMARFSNAALRHRTRQIAVDGSQKLPQRLLATASARLSAGLPIPALALGIAAWIRWQEGRTEAGEVVVVEDPLSDETARRLTAATDDRARVAAVLDLSAVFPPALSGDPVFREAVTTAFEDLRRLGAIGAAAMRMDQAA